MTLAARTIHVQIHLHPPNPTFTLPLTLLNADSTYVSAGASAGEVEAALEGLEPTGDLTVTRSENDDNGYDWQVTKLKGMPVTKLGLCLI